MNRRDFLKNNSSKLALIYLYSVFNADHCLAANVDPIIRNQLKTINDLGIWVKAGTLKVEQWQDSVERIFSTFRVDDLIKALDIEKYLDNLDLEPGKVSTKTLNLKKTLELPQQNKMKAKVLAFTKDTFIAPHAHNNLLSAHFVLKGSLEAKTYNRVREKKGSMDIEPVQNRTLRPGDFISMSDERENIHGFHALEDKTVVFYLLVKDAQPGKTYINPGEWKGMVYLDIKEETGAKLLKSSVILKKEAYKQQDGSLS